MKLLLCGGFEFFEGCSQLFETHTDGVGLATAFTALPLEQGDLHFELLDAAEEEIRSSLSLDFLRLHFLLNPRIHHVVFRRHIFFLVRLHLRLDRLSDLLLSGHIALDLRLNLRSEFGRDFLAEGSEVSLAETKLNAHLAREYGHLRTFGRHLNLN